MSGDTHDIPVDQNLLWDLLAGTAAETGEQFFKQLVKHLARAMGTRCAWVTEWREDNRRLRALAFWAGTGYVDDYEYDVANTPCEAVIDERRLVHVPDRVVELYVHDPDLPPLKAVSYLGLPLFDTDGSLLGHLAILHDEPMPEEPRATAVLSIFGARAGAELQRLRRDRALKEHEQKLSRLIERAMDAIIEFDGALAIRHMNPAAEQLFGCTKRPVSGYVFEHLFPAGSRGKLSYLARQLDREAEGHQSIWIPDGLEGMRANGQRFPAEATLSRYELDGHPYYALILRNSNERLEADARLRTLMNETAYLRAEIQAIHEFGDLIGTSPALRQVLAEVEQVAASDTTVLLIGETGTGKELVARAIHQRSARSAEPLITVNCAAIPAGLQESEFFGHERGAFTGATQRRDGRFRLADGGTLFLDEVGELPVDLQAKLLRVLQEGEFEPVGSSKTQRVDVRVVTATNRNLEHMVEQGLFRRDLLYRLNVFPIHLPPLRERGDDVVLIAEAFARKLAQRYGRTIGPLPESAKARLKRYDWPGNVRELHNVIERAFLTSLDGRTLNLDRALPEAPARPATAHGDEAERSRSDARILTQQEVETFERENLLRALTAAKWKIAGADGAAARLGLHPNTLSSRMKALQIVRPYPIS